MDFLKIKSSEDYGGIFDVSLWNNFQGEFMWNRQPTSLSAHNPNDGTYSFVSNMNLDMYQFDVLYQFNSLESKLKGVRPFVVAGLGLFSFWRVVGKRPIAPRLQQPLFVQLIVDSGSEN